MVTKVICPICKATVPFSLEMHMKMAHGPGSKPVTKGKLPMVDDPSERPMNERKAAHVRKLRHKKKEVPRPKKF